MNCQKCGRRFKRKPIALKACQKVPYHPQHSSHRELALKESTESKRMFLDFYIFHNVCVVHICIACTASKSKLSAAASSKQEDQPRRQKSASQKDDRTRATGGERALVSKAPDRVSSAVSEVQAPAAQPSSPSDKRVEKMETSPSETPPVLPPTPSPLSVPSATKSHSKKKSVEGLSLSGEAAAIAHEESPLPFPMTVPKEEQLHVSMVAGGLSHALSQPLSPEMHIIVQQPNIAAITSSGSTPTVQEAMEIDFKSTSSVLTQPQPQPVQTQAPSQPPPTVPGPVAAAAGRPQESSSPQSKAAKEEARPLGGGGVATAAPAAPPQPKLVATPSSSGQAPLSALKLVLKPSQPPVSTNQSNQSPTPTLPSTTVSPVVVSQAQAQTLRVRVQADPRSPLQPTSRLVTHTMRSPSTTSAPPNLPHISPSTTHPPPPPPSSTPTPHPLPPVTLSSPTTTVVSSVLADPRLSAGTLRPGVRVPPPQAILPQPQGVVLAPPKAKQQVKIKSKTLEESEKKSHAVEESVAKPAEVSRKVEKREEVLLCGSCCYSCECVSLLC